MKSLRFIFHLALVFGIVGLLSLPVFGQSSTNWNHGFAPGIPDPSLLNHQPWTDSQLANPGVWHNIFPSGIASVDFAALNGAIQANEQNIKLGPGNFQICSPIVHASYIPIRISGTSGNTNPGSTGYSSTYGITSISCNGTYTFVNGNAFLTLSDHDTVDHLLILGRAITNGGTYAAVNCINMMDVFGVLLDHVDLAGCYHDVSVTGDGSTGPGHIHNYTQDVVIQNSNIFEPDCDGVHINYSNGSFVSDSDIINNDFLLSGDRGGGNTCATGSELYENFSGTRKIIGNTFEFTNATPGSGMRFDNMGYGGLIANNEGDKVQFLYINGTGSVFNFAHFVGNFSDGCCDGPPTGPDLILNGNIFSVTFSGNRFAQIQATTGTVLAAGTAFDGNFYVSGYQPAAYYDNITENIVLPVTTPKTNAYLSPINSGLGTFDTPNILASSSQLLFLQHSGSANTFGCPTGGYDGQSVALQLVQSPAGSDTVTWPCVIGSPPAASTSPYAHDTYLFSELGGSLVYDNHSLATLSNLITGGNPITASNWTCTGVAFTQSQPNDPVFSSTNTTMAETAATSVHGCQQNITVSGASDVTYCLWVSNVGGAEYIELYLQQSGPYYIDAVFNPSTGAVTGMNKSGNSNWGPTGGGAFLAETVNGQNRVCIQGSNEFGVAFTTAGISMNNTGVNTTFAFAPLSYLGAITNKISTWGATVWNGDVP